MVVLSVHIISENPNVYRALHSDDIFAMVFLLHPPVFKGDTVGKHGRVVGLVDPLDMLPFMYEFRKGESDDPKVGRAI